MSKSDIIIGKSGKNVKGIRTVFLSDFGSPISSQEDSNSYEQMYVSSDPAKWYNSP
jgi:predicted RNA-binding protein YlqC (UPF0109 family)